MAKVDNVIYFQLFFYSMPTFFIDLNKFFSDLGKVLISSMVLVSVTVDIRRRYRSTLTETTVKHFPDDQQPLKYFLT